MADYINLRDQRRMRITLPPPLIQTRIAEVLGSVDGLIENNRRQAEALEAMARAIYREWFVHFQYPGHEHATFFDSPIGPLPFGWEAPPLHHVARVVRGRSYRKHELVETGGRPFVNLKCMRRGGGFRRDGLKRFEGACTAEQLVDANDIVLAITDLTQGREILAQATLVPTLRGGPGVISLDVVRVLPHRSEDRLWVYAALRWSGFADRVKVFANGSTVLHLGHSHVATGHLPWPSGELRRSFLALLEPSLAIVEGLLDASERLESIRDLLLPKLLSGEIDVSSLDLDALVEESVA